MVFYRYFLINFTLNLRLLSCHTVFYEVPRQVKYTAIIEKGGVQCFYQPVSKETQTVTLQYEVTKANFDLDIDCIVKDGNGNQLMAARRRKGRKIEIDTNKITGEDIEICFSNHYSRMDEKQIYFNLILDNKSGFVNINQITNDEFVKALFFVASQRCPFVSTPSPDITTYIPDLYVWPSIKPTFIKCIF